MFGFPKKKLSGGSRDPAIMIIAQLNARVQPTDRGEYFEEPLDEVLKSEGIGQVTGGGTLFADEPYGIEYSDVEIMVHEASDSVVQKIIAELEKLGAPRGSLLKFEDRDDMRFGRLEGMAVFLDGVYLPAEVYETSDVNHVIDSCDKLIEGVGQMQGYWQGSQETALYFYGTIFEAMQTLTADFLATEPLCQNARIVKIA
ncbi:MAG: hypothetical protein AAFZ10_17000 [Pseudomonadota bacterium]